MIREEISADTRADGMLDNNSDSQDLSSPSSTPPSTPPPVLEEDLNAVGQWIRHSRSSKEPSTVIGKSSERKDPLEGELDMLISSYRSMEKDTRMTSDFDVMESQQGKVAKVTRTVDACASCRRKRHVVISLPSLVVDFITYT